MVQLKSVLPDEELMAYQKVLEWFFAYPTDEFTLNDVYKELDIAKTTARKTVLRLVNEGFLTVRKLGKLWRINSNQQHQYFITKKIPYNLMLVYASRAVYYVLQQVPSARAIILFGSYRKGDDENGSDLDIAVEVLGDKEMEVREVGLIRQFGYRKNVKVNLHIFSRSKVDFNVFTSIANGILLHGLLEVKPYDKKEVS